MIFGTDAGVYPHGDNARPFAKMVAWGMTPIQAIRTAPLNGAEALDMTGDVGSLAVGRYADIIAVARNPLTVAPRPTPAAAALYANSQERRSRPKGVPNGIT